MRSAFCTYQGDHSPLPSVSRLDQEMSIRTEFAPAVLLGVLPLLTLVPARRRWWYAGGLVGAMAVYAVHLGVVGPERIVRVISDLVSSGSGRRLPVPGLSEYLGRLFAVSLVVLLALIAVGALLWCRSRDRPAPQLLVAVALFGFAAIPYVLSRPDVLHVRPFAVLPLSLLPALLLVGIDALLTRERARRGLVAAIAALAVAVVVHEGDFSVDRARELRNVRSTYRGFVDDDSRHATGVVIARLRALARPGDSLFVGPLDLRRTNYGPTYMYFVLDDLEPASYYMEMNPGSANREGSGLADELRRADWLILTSEWDNWSEDNESAENGSAEPNEVVSDEFCLTVARGQYRLYERCDRAA